MSTEDDNQDEARTRVRGGEVTPVSSPPADSVLSRLRRRLPMRLGGYILEKHLGTGGMAEVYLAQPEQSEIDGIQRHVVVKLLLPHLASRPKYVAMFQREATLATSVVHPNLVRVFEYGVEDDTPFIVMEYVDGIGLQELARRSWSRKRSIPLEVCANAIADAALGLAHAHEKGLVHRDISPDNIMITKEGVTKVLDFGIAKSASSESFTRTDEIKGKVPFMAPEMVRGQDIDHRVDLFALGVTFYWLVTTERPFKGPSEVATIQSILTHTAKRAVELNTALPAPVDELLATMIEKDRDLRVASGRHIHQALAWAEPARATVVKPFVEEMLALADDPDFQTPDKDFIPSIPSLDLVQRMDLTAVETPLRVARREKTGSGSVQAATAPAQLAEAEGKKLLKLAVAAALGIGAIAGVVVMLPGESAQPVTVLAPRVADAGTTASTDTANPVDAGPRSVPNTDAGPTPKRDGGERQREQATKSVEVRGPASARWLAAGKEVGKGDGQVTIPERVQELVAVESKRGGRVNVPIANGVADFSKAPRGKLQVRAFPYATVTIGTEKLGNTPFPDVELPAGQYTITLGYGTKSEKKTVTIKPRQTERITVRFE